MYRHGRFIVFNPNGIALESYRILKAISSHKNIEVMWANSSDFCASWPPDWPFVVGAVAFGYDVEYSEFEEATCSLRIPVSPSESEQNDSFITWRNFNAEEFQTIAKEVQQREMHDGPAPIELLGTNRVMHKSEELIMDIELNNQTKSSLLRDLAAFAITLGHVVLVSSFVTIPLQERVARFKKQRNMDSDVLLVGGEEIELKPGECVALLGQKSDTRPIITQMATAARKRCGNFKLANSSGPQVAFCSRENSLFPSLSLKSNLEIIAGIAGQSLKTVKKMFAALHEKNRVNSPFSQCSKMEQRRACITATAMSASPVILFEMPAYAVDLKTRLYTWDVIRGLQRAGRTVIFTTDSHEECE
ncbi:hypothetical protein NECAME_09654, partial [Necator americanus]